MKILYINRPKPDYIQDFLFLGLSKVLGVKNIIEFPWNVRYHLNFRKHPKNIGVIKGNFISSIYNSFRSDFDLVIVASCHAEVFERYLSILPKIKPSTPIFFFDGGDFSEVGGDLNRLGGYELFERAQEIRPFNYIFKREYLTSQKYDSNVISLPMCFSSSLLPEFKNIKKYDVSFWAVESHPIRTEVLNLISDKFDCTNNGTVRHQIMKKYNRKGAFYFQELNSCKIGLNFRGVGWDTLRYWELPAVGSFMLTQEPEILIENNFVHEKEVVFCNDVNELVSLCEYYLKNDFQREKIASAGKMKLYDFHTDVERAKQVLKYI